MIEILEALQEAFGVNLTWGNAPKAFLVHDGAPITEEQVRNVVATNAKVQWQDAADPKCGNEGNVLYFMILVDWGTDGEHDTMAAIDLDNQHFYVV